MLIEGSELADGLRTGAEAEDGPATVAGSAFEYFSSSMPWRVLAKMAFPVEKHSLQPRMGRLTCQSPICTTILRRMIVSTAHVCGSSIAKLTGYHPGTSVNLPSVVLSRDGNWQLVDTQALKYLSMGSRHDTVRGFLGGSWGFLSKGL